MLTGNQAAIRRVRRVDRAARWVITLGGITVIASVVAIVVLIVGVTVPLFMPAAADRLTEAPLPASVGADDVLRVDVTLTLDERLLTATILDSDGTFWFYDPREKSVRARYRATPPGGDSELSVVFAEQCDGDFFSLLWSDGSVSLVEAVAEAKFDEQGVRYDEYSLRDVATVPADEKLKMPTKALLRRSSEGAITCLRVLPDDRMIVDREVTKEDPLGLGGAKKETSRLVIDRSKGFPASLSSVVLNGEGDRIYGGTTDGRLVAWKLGPDGGLRKTIKVRAFPDKRSITAMNLVLGDITLAVGDEKGMLTTWRILRSGGEEKLRQIHKLAELSAPIRDILPSRRNKSLLTLDDNGLVHLDYMTSERHLLDLKGSSPYRMIGYSSIGNATVALDEKGRLVTHRIDCPHPEVSFSTLFGKVWYEGYDEPSYKWQTTGGQESEKKFSLVPIVFGTIKATIYAMVFAVPLALFGAIYTSHFTTPDFRRSIKPIVEIMAALPSVVIGFLVALWLGPIVAKWIVAVFISLLTIPLTFVAFMVVWQPIRQFDWAKRIENGYEFLVLIPVIGLGALLAAVLMPGVERVLFEGNFRQWLFDTTGNTYDPRNSIIVAIGLGFAVIPIIFSIAEDSLSNIPHSLTAASLALGASRWQTVRRVILPSASPGIFAAIMIGFGRAVGETMIVLMATGNTPILDWSPFNGFRTLSANIAVEIPEVPVGGTLYRVLFLCAVLLFLMTFLLNTAAELVRNHLRKQFGRY